MKSELTYQEITELFDNYLEWQNEFIDSQSLDSNTKQKSIDLIINKLNSKNPTIRYIASHMIIEFNIEQAKQKLIDRIRDEDTLDYNGTMTYALSHLSCQNNLKEVFGILATQGYESKCHAYNILSEQTFEFSRNDLEDMRKLLEEVEQNKTKNQIYDDETFNMVKDGYEGFKDYLTEQ